MTRGATSTAAQGHPRCSQLGAAACRDVAWFGAATLAQWANTQTYEGHSHYVMMVAFNPKDANTFASASLDRTIKVWGLGTLQPQWHEEQAFALTSPSTLLHVLVFDWDRLGEDDIIGEALVDIEPYAATSAAHELRLRMTSLAPTPPQYTPSGYLHLQLTVSGFDKEAE